MHASRGKSARAEPIALKFETGKALFAGEFPELEAELASEHGVVVRAQERAGGREAICACVAEIRLSGGRVRSLPDLRNCRR
jgi:phage terminase large subunit-like protein